ncbi:MAG TPA: DUF937 domain-containing protein [Pedomonas sp.]|uniref:DUF937 domain-containing protein n=1 Tax=Pedomonas sp. TaxID=2976421 RepID=UPI002F3F9CDD
MNVTDMLRQTGALDSISRELGINQQQAQTGASALLPALLGGFRKQAQMESSGGPGAGGSGGLLGLLGSLGGGNLLNTVTSQQPTPREPGNEILGQLFGSKDVSRTVAGQAAQQTGMDPSLLKKMLPLLAMAVSGYLASRGGAAQQSAAPGAGGALGQMLGGATGQRSGPSGGQSSGGLGSGGLGSLLSGLDTDRDGNPLDDIMRMVGQFRR